jgi:DNA-binding NarL/FixJ family response regulator
METVNTINISLTDDHPMVITGIMNMLLPYQHIQVLSSYNTGTDLLNGLKKQQPDVLLLDIQLPDITGNDLMRTINKQYPMLKVLALTSTETPFYVRDMMQNGCMGYVLKHINQQALVHAIEEVFEGRQYMEAELKEELLQGMLKTKKQARSALITRREKEILQMIAKEMTNQQIADTLFVSCKTVENHRFSLMHKLGVKNTVGLITTALKLGLID